MENSNNLYKLKKYLNKISKKNEKSSNNFRIYNKKIEYYNLLFNENIQFGGDAKFINSIIESYYPKIYNSLFNENIQFGGVVIAEDKKQIKSILYNNNSGYIKHFRSLITDQNNE